MSTATQHELRLAQQWFEQHFGGAANCPLTFTCGGAPAAEVLGRSQVETADEPLAGGSRRTLTFADPQTGLQVRLVVTRWDGYPAVEWVAYLRNAGSVDTPILADIKPLAVSLPADEKADCRLHHALGSDCKIDDFAPRETPLGVGAETAIQPFGGRSSEGALPFFNLQTGDGGVIGAIGWTGGWRAEFRRDKEGVSVTAGMRRTHLVLHPGEEIRTPRILLLFWQGDRWHGHNLLRRLTLEHYSPRPGGQPLRAPIAFAVWGENTAENQLAKARWWREQGIDLDTFWIDAGWHGDNPYQENSTVFNSSWPQHVGNWWPNKHTYPEGLAPIGQALRELGMGFVLWFEPERVYRGTWFTREHPEWLLGPVGDNYLLNLGLPEARRGLTDLISRVIEEGGITVYRQDFNMAPDPFWEAADAPDRVGMSEIRHIEGLYAFWDELLARHPGLVIDNCSSGGRRIDLETNSRSIPLWRSDYQCFPGFDPIGIQGQTHGLAPWVPLSTGCVDRPVTYDFHSALGPGIVISSTAYERTPPPPYPADWLRDRVAELRVVQPYFHGDFYPLLSYSMATDTWAAWQLDRPDLGEGAVIALRRQDSPFTHLQAVLRGLEPNGRYELWPLGGGKARQLTGAELLGEGFGIEIAERPSSAVFLYRKVG